MAYPDWVEKQRIKGTNISCIRGKYYLYEATSVWDKEKGRAQKKTGKYLGRITEEGLIPPRKQQEQTPLAITTMEYGASNVLYELGDEIYRKLKERFPREADTIFSLAILRVIERCPYKRAAFLYEKSFLSEIFGKQPLSGASISGFLRTLGQDREKIVGFMKEFMSGTENILFDGTNIITKSEGLEINRLGYNSHRQYDPQINLLYAFSAEKRLPVYYRVVSGNIRDVTSFSQAVNESGISDMVVIADKGFGSEANFEMLEERGLKYIVPLRRNNGLFIRDRLKAGNRDAFDGYFMFNGRVIWYYSYEVDGKRLVVYLDNDLKNEEEKDYIRRIESNIEDYSHEGFLRKQYDFGTIIFRTNLDVDAEKLYCLYKSRGEIEQSFDSLKNLLELDIVYLQDKYAVEAWAFINHISLMLTFLVYNLLRSKNQLSKYSVADFLAHMKYVHKIKVNNQWLTSEISGKTIKLLTCLDLHIT